jgi:TPR repeat protein
MHAHLSACYAEVSRNDEQATTYLFRAAQLGHVEAKFHLACFYAEGIGIYKNLEQAQSWFRAAALD